MELVEAEIGIGLSAGALVLGFPLLMLGMIWLLGALEAWMLQPDERAAAVQALLDQADGAEEVEMAVAELLAEVADRPAPDGGRHGDAQQVPTASPGGRTDRLAS